MLDNVLLATLAIEIGALVLLLFGVLLVNRVWRQRRAARAADDAGRLDAPLRVWLAGGPVEPVAALLAPLPAAAALEQLLGIAAARLTPEARTVIGARLRGEGWVRRTLRGARSPWWWRRLEAARLLTVVGTPDDARVVRRLLADRHVAVRSAATPCLAVCGAELAAFIVDRLPAQPEALRRQQGDALRQHAWQAAEHALLARLVDPGPRRGGDDAPAVEAWLRLARTVGTPAALHAALGYRTHPHVGVRTEAVLAAGQLFGPAAFDTVATACDDAEPMVRAAAARAATGFGPAARRLVPLLDRMLHDRVWTVRHRAALALAQLGEPGREALRRARHGSDAFARDMAVLVSGLSDGALLEVSST